MYGCGKEKNIIAINVVNSLHNKIAGVSIFALSSGVYGAITAKMNPNQKRTKDLLKRT